MDSVLSDFLEERRVYDGTYSHVSQLETHSKCDHRSKGKFFIPLEDEPEFWNLYSNRLTELGSDFVSGLSEIPNEYMPVLADFDFTLDLPSDDYEPTHHFYTNRHLEAVVKIFQDVLKYMLGDDYDRKHMSCFVLEKSRPYIKGEKVKNGFHLHFPFLFINKLDYEIHLIPRVKERIDAEQPFNDVPGYAEASLDAYDTKSYIAHWLLYGSTKKVGREPYLLTKIISSSGKLQTLSSLFEGPSAIPITDGRGRKIQIVKHIEWYLPQILSVKGVGRPQYESRPGIECLQKAKLLKAVQIKGTFDNNMSAAQAVEICKELVPMLSAERASNYDTWLRVGYCLYTLTGGSIEGLELWLQFSQKTTKGNYSEKSCVYEYNEKMHAGTITVGSLRMWAQEDSPEEYAAFKLQEQRKCIANSLNGGHTDFAQMLYDMFSKEYVCAAVKENIWYQFVDHRWKQLDCGITLQKKIYSVLLPRFVEENRILLEIHQKSGEEIDTSDVMQKVAKLNKIMAKLKDSSFKRNIMKECQELFYNGDFIKMLDTNKYLVGFNNGVLDLKEGLFRPGRPEDFVTMSTGYDFKEFNDEDAQVEDVMYFFQKIFPDPAKRTYFLEWASSLYKGGNDSKTFIVMSGAGDNGKSVVIDFLQMVLGQYAITFPTTLLTGKSTQSSQATPELARAPGARFAVLQEPDDKAELNNGQLKIMTGNDKFFVRPLYGQGYDMRPLYKLAFICNKLPKIPCEDTATWERIRRLVFESYFPKNPFLVPMTWEEQVKKKIFPRDDKLTEKLPDMAQAFAWIMFQQYKLVAKRGYTTDPESVIEATQLYRQMNDFYLQFMNECLIKDNNKTSNPEGLRLNELWESFKDWFRKNMNGKTLPDKNVVKDQFVKKLGVLKVNKWSDWRMKTDDDEVKEGNAMVINDDDLTDYDNTDAEATDVEEMVSVVKAKSKVVDSDNEESVEDNNFKVKMLKKKSIF
jgi:P4 family phage/plasmid primase-like protien